MEIETGVAAEPVAAVGSANAFPPLALPPAPPWAVPALLAW
ncbi:MAG: hypothetical protein ABR528_02890 [Pseudonocardiaceae bacterium]